MPIVSDSSYSQPPRFQFNGHLQTIFPTFRKVKNINYQRRERIDTTDGDFLDLDWIQNKNKRLVVLTHGFEGNSHRPYILGMAKMFSENGWDVLAWNCRSCSGEMNRAFRMYNHGDTVDIGTVINHAIDKHGYNEVVPIGFSMGGNVSLKYAAVAAHPSVSKVIAFSAPLDMKTTSDILGEKRNWVYRRNFETKIQPKLEFKIKQFPNKLTKEDITKKDWNEQLETYFCKINGFKDLATFYEYGSALNFIEQIKIPALIVQAKNDPLLTPECFPFELAKNHPFIHLEAPENGGHCGFPTKSESKYEWAELRAFEFLNN